MKALICIGGPHDGQLIAHAGISFSTALPDKGQEEPVVRVYDMVQLEGENETFEFWAFRGMTHDDVLRQLIANYRPA